MATDFRQIELDDSHRHLLANAADQLRVPWPEVFDKAFAPFVQPLDSVQDNGVKETPYDLMLRHGLIGSIEGTPSDLSTNEKHMSGYGKHG